MSDTRLNLTGLNYFFNRLKSFFAAKSDIPTKTSDLTNDSGFITGYTETDPTVPAWAKAASKPTYTAQEVGALPNSTVIPTKVSDLTNDSGFIIQETDPTVPAWAKAANKPAYTAAEVGALSSSDVANNLTTTDAGKVLDARQGKALKDMIPVKVSDLTNDSGYQTASDVSSAISAAVGSAYKFKGSVATVADLPNNAAVGDVYDVQATGINYAWTGTAWDALGQLVDTSMLWSKSELVAITTAQIDNIVDA